MTDAPLGERGRLGNRRLSPLPYRQMNAFSYLSTDKGLG